LVSRLAGKRPLGGWYGRIIIKQDFRKCDSEGWIKLAGDRIQMTDCIILFVP
jgi:hypothetical protein